MHSLCSLAKRIERGKKAVLKAISRTPMAAQEVIRLGERLRAAEVTVKDVVIFNEEDGSDVQAGPRRAVFGRRARCSFAGAVSWSRCATGVRLSST